MPPLGPNSLIGGIRFDHILFRSSFRFRIRPGSGPKRPVGSVWRIGEKCNAAISYVGYLIELSFIRQAYGLSYMHTSARVEEELIGGGTRSIPE